MSNFHGLHLGRVLQSVQLISLSFFALFAPFAVNNAA